MSKRILLLTLFLSTFEDNDCKCVRSFAIFCDQVADIKDYLPAEIATWSELVIGDREAGDHSKMVSIDAKTIPIGRMEKLTSLTLLNMVQDIQSYAFTADHDYTKVERITIHGGQLTRLKYTSFDSYYLRKLTISNTQLEYITEGFFYNCHIQTIDLSYNKIEEIGADIFTGFTGANETRELILRHNAIASLEQNCFPDGLEILNLDHNKLLIFNPGAFKNLVNLKELTASHNRMSSPIDIRPMLQLRQVDFSHNNLYDMQMEYLNNLEFIHRLELSFNRIHSPALFEKFNLTERSPYLQISLIFNRLTHLFLDNEVLKGHVILFYGNPWHCKCWMKMEQYLTSQHFERNKCDVKYFYNGQTPHCFEYGDNFTCEEKVFKGPKVNDSDLDLFLSSIEANKKLFHCDLTLVPW